MPPPKEKSIAELNKELDRELPPTKRYRRKPEHLWDIKLFIQSLMKPYFRDTNIPFEIPWVKSSFFFENKVIL